MTASVRVPSRRRVWPSRRGLGITAVVVAFGCAGCAASRSARPAAAEPAPPQSPEEARRRIAALERQIQGDRSALGLVPAERAPASTGAQAPAAGAREPGPVTQSSRVEPREPGPEVSGEAADARAEEEHDGTRPRSCPLPCRRARAICRAARHICQLADYLAEQPARRSCARARQDCEAARRATADRCTGECAA